MSEEIEREDCEGLEGGLNAEDAKITQRRREEGSRGRGRWGWDAEADEEGDRREESLGAWRLGEWRGWWDCCMMGAAP